MPHLHPNHLLTKHGSSIYYQGPDLQLGPLPAVIFFALSAQASLFEDPFNQPVLRLSQQGVRVFSWDLPFHGLNLDPHDAMRHWMRECAHSPSFIADFLDLCQHNINDLVENGLVTPHQLGVAGLSRGGFIAAHLAARDARLKTVLGFAPLTSLKSLEEGNLFPEHTFDQINALAVAEKLKDRNLRFYIGNHDRRVGTEACFNFIQHLTQIAFDTGIRSPRVELMIYPSVGHKGHGTPPHIFRDGADWIKQQLLQ